MSWIVGEFNKRQTTTIIYLGRQHKTDLIRCHFRCQMDHALNILHSVAVSISIAQTAVSKGCCSGPDKSHKTVVSVPCVDHGIKFITWSFYLKM